MKKLLNNQVLFGRINVAVVFIWMGMLLAISFMEAWIKFQAPGITLALGLGIGKLVFAALNGVELLWFLVLILCATVCRRAELKKNYLLLSLGAILALQSFYLLPILNQRADQYVLQIPVSASYHHFIYGALDAVKLVVLVCLGIRGYKILQLLDAGRVAV